MSDKIKELIIEAKKSMQKKVIFRTILILDRAHKIGIRENACEDLVDINNLLALLHYQNNDYGSFRKSLIFARNLA